MRRLARVELIQSINPILGRDRIELAQIQGWTVVVQKGLFSEGSLCLYVEPDAFLPAEPPWSELVSSYSPARPHPITGHIGHRVKVAKIAGQPSYGLAVPLFLVEHRLGNFQIGEDLSDRLGITLWETPPPAILNGQTRGPWPYWIIKTDEERVQNIPDWVVENLTIEPDWYATEKLDGASITIYRDGDEYGVCSRNMNLKPDPPTRYWQTALEYRLHDLIRECFPNEPLVALQGELIGPNIQKNPLRLKTHEIALFNLQIGPDRIPFNQWPEPIQMLSVPHRKDILPTPNKKTLLNQTTNIRSQINPEVQAEGIVWRRLNHTTTTNPTTQEILPASFKVINFNYLIKEKNDEEEN